MKNNYEKISAALYVAAEKFVALSPVIKAELGIDDARKKRSKAAKRKAQRESSTTP